MKTWILVGTSLLVLVLHSLRSPLLATSSILYGEEGRIFFLQNFQFGIAAIYKSYAGYQHLFPRLIALLATPVAIEHVGWYFHLTALIAHSFLLYATIRFTENRDLSIRIAALLAGVLIPHAGEVYMNLPNTINILTPVPLLLYLAPPANGRRLYIDLFAFVIAALSGPAILIALLLMIGFTVLKRRWNFLTICAVATSAAQLTLMNLSARPANHETFDLTMFFHVITSFFYPLFFGWIPGQASMDQQLGVLFVFAAAISIYYYRTREKIELGAIAIVSLAMLLWVAALFKGLGTPSWLHPLGGGHRYFWAPYVLVSIALLTGIEGRRVRATLVALIFFSGIVNFGRQLPIDPNRASYDLDESTGAMSVKVYPEPWDFKFNPAEPTNPQYFYEK